MRSTLHLLSLLMLTIFASQAWPVMAVPATLYEYDVSIKDTSAENTELEHQNYAYDNIENLQHYGVKAITSSQDEKTKIGSFFAFDNGLFVTNSANAFSKVAPATAKQLQKKFKHAEDFGVSGNYNPANAKKFNEAIQNHLNSPGVKEISGSYRGNPVSFHTNPNTGLTVIQNPNGSFLSGWKLNPQQLQHVLKDGKL